MHDTDLPEVALTTLPVGKSHEDRLEVRNSNSSFLFDVSRKKIGKISRKLGMAAYFSANSLSPFLSCTFLDTFGLVNVPDNVNSITTLKLSPDQSTENIVAIFSKC